MSKDDERPQFNPKHRIAGAIILVSLAVIFVPMLLEDSSPSKETQVLTDIPNRDAPASETKVVVTPVPAPGATAPASPKTQTAAAEPVAEQLGSTEKPVSATAPIAKTETTKTETPKNEAKSSSMAAVSTNDSNAAKARPVTARSNDVADKNGKGWVVQVGTFTNTENADRLREKLKSHGYAVNAEIISVQGNKAVRLRVGPFHDKPAASKAQAQLQKDFSIQGMVLATP